MIVNEKSTSTLFNINSMSSQSHYTYGTSISVYRCTLKFLVFIEKKTHSKNG